MLGLVLLVSLTLFACGKPPLPVDGGEDAGRPGCDAAVDAATADAQALLPDLGDGDAGERDAASGWRSTLYPADWLPGFHDGEGRFLHDFSYAGYGNGERPMPTTPAGAIFDVVVGYGANNQGSADATAAVQAAIQAAQSAGGGIVFFPAGIYRLDGSLLILHSGIVLRGAGPLQTRLYFTTSADLGGGANLRFHGEVTGRPATPAAGDLPLVVDGANQSRVVRVADASGLTAGEDVSLGWVITDEFVAEHGMTGVWTTSNGQWRRFFRRQVAAVDVTQTPHAVTLDVPLRYPAKLRDQASLWRESGYLSECGLESLSLSNAIDWETAQAHHRMHLVAFEGVKDCWIRDVHSFASPLGGGDHVQDNGFRIEGSKRVTVADCRLERAQNRGSGGDGYLYEVTTSSEVLLRDSYARAGRHNFIQNWDFGTSGCVFLRCESRESAQYEKWFGIWIEWPAASEYHHSLAMANLVDEGLVYDGWEAVNRGDYSSGAGHAATQSVFWNLAGTGTVVSRQFGWGYVIGEAGTPVETSLGALNAAGTAPQDFVEQRAGALAPASLYEDQLVRRLQSTP